MVLSGIATIFFVLWRGAEIITLIPVIGMLVSLSESAPPSVLVR